MDLLYNDELTLGKIFGKQHEARTLVDGWKKTLNALPKPPQGVQPLKVFVYDSGEDKSFTSGRYAMPTAIIEAAGGKNVMDDLEMSWGPPPGRAWRQRNPILLFFSIIRPAAALIRCAVSSKIIR